jgi:hypothetical protein
MNFHVADAGECCAACKAHRRECEAEGTDGRTFWKPSVDGDGVCGNHKWQDKKVGCNAWVYCAEEQCFSFDIHVHRKGECWLKYVEDPAPERRRQRVPARHAGRAQAGLAVGGGGEDMARADAGARELDGGDPDHQGGGPAGARGPWR